MKSKTILFLSFFFLFLLDVSCYSSHRSQFHLRQDKKAPQLPKLSTIVLGTNNGGLTEFNEFLGALQPYNLTQGECRSIFRLCDRDKDDRISPEEWDACVNSFVLPYEQTCLKGKDYMLASADITKCMTLPVFSVVPTRPQGTAKLEDEVFQTLNREDEKKLNFADYIFLRRVAFAWKECSVDNRINKRRMECALSATTAQRRKFLPVSFQVFNVAIQLYKTKVKENEAFLDFFSFAKIAYTYYYFNEFELPHQEEYISKKAILQGIEDQILPTSVTVEFANQVYYAFDPENDGFKARLDFAAYASVNHLFRTYKRNAEKDKKKNANFTAKSFEKMIKESEWEYFDTVLLEGVNFLDDKEFNALVEMKDTRNSMGVDDREFFTRFAQITPTEKYKVIFNIFDVKMQGSWNFTTLLQFAKLTWAFQLTNLKNDGLINNEDINGYLRLQQPIIPFNTVEMKKFDIISETIRNDQINVKQYYSFFTYDKMFQNLIILNSNHAMTLTNLRLCMSQLGLKLSNQTKKFAKEFLALSKLPSFNYEKAFKRAVKEEVLLNKVSKLKTQDKKYVKNENELSLNSKGYKKYFETEMKGDSNWNPHE